MPGVPALDPSSDHAEAGRDMSSALEGRSAPVPAWAVLAPADGQERLRSREERLLPAAPALMGLLRCGERDPSRGGREDVEEDGEGEAIAALPFLVDNFKVKLYSSRMGMND